MTALMRAARRPCESCEQHPATRVVRTRFRVCAGCHDTRTPATSRAATVLAIGRAAVSYAIPRRAMSAWRQRRRDLAVVRMLRVALDSDEGRAYAQPILDHLSLVAVGIELDNRIREDVR